MEPVTRSARIPAMDAYGAHASHTETPASSGAGGEGPSLAEVLQKSNHWLEVTHDYIQWVFPMQQASRAVRYAPVLTFDDIREITRYRVARLEHHVSGSTENNEFLWARNGTGGRRGMGCKGGEHRPQRPVDEAFGPQRPSSDPHPDVVSAVSAGGLCECAAGVSVWLA